MLKVLQSPIAGNVLRLLILVCILAIFVFEAVNPTMPPENLTWFILGYIISDSVSRERKSENASK